MTETNRRSARTGLRAVLTISCSAIGLLAAGTAPAFAQTAANPETTELEEVVVTGIRASLRASTDIKRNAIGVVDSVSSEAIGKFPDSNVAESLQRIPGVSIDRSGGEGRFVTVRGFGPEFNTVLLNGRTFASDNEGRAFSFDLLAAELISGADVYKAPLASLQDGGIGSTINVHTARPLTLGTFKGILSAKGLYEKNSKQTTPQVFGLLSNTFADDTIGALVSVSYQSRETRRPFIENRGYIPGTTVGNPASPLFTNVFAPRNQDIGVDEQERERIGLNATFQYQPTENLTFTVDALWNQFTVDSTVRSIGNWFEPSSYTAATIDSNRTVTSLTTNGFADMIVTSNKRDVTTEALGFNAAWNISDSITVNFDSSWSKAEDSAGGDNLFTVIGVPSTYSFAQATGDGFPSVFNYSTDITNSNLGRAHIALRQGADRVEEVFEQRIDGEYTSDWGALKNVRAGIAYTDRSKENLSIQSDPNTLCLYCGYPIATPASLLQRYDVGGFLDGGGRFPAAFLTYDPNAFFKFLESNAAAAALNAARGLPAGTVQAQLALTNGYNATPQPNSYSVQEVTTAVYASADFAGDLGEMPWALNVGIRYMNTDVTAEGQQLTLTDLLPVPGDVTIYNAVYANAGKPVVTRKESDYAEFLPNVNFKINLTDQIVARASISKSLTRPQISLLAPRTNFDTVRPASLDASGGNPDLKPYVSTNYDFSLEWYPTRSTSFSIAPFRKTVADFIVQTRASEVFPIANAGNLPVGVGGITGARSATFSVRRPRNIEEASVKGVEIAANVAFDFLDGWASGFGVQANATLVNSDATFAPGSTTQSFALEGLGDSYNLTGYYEAGKISARVSYNYRDRFLEYLVTPGQGGDPVYRRAFGQVDARGSYQVSKTFQVFFEGTNLTDEQNIQTGRFDNQVLSVQNNGPRYAFGLRWDF